MGNGKKPQQAHNSYAIHSISKPAEAVDSLVFGPFGVGVRFGIGEWCPKRERRSCWVSAEGRWEVASRDGESGKEGRRREGRRPEAGTLRSLPPICQLS